MGFGKLREAASQPNWTKLEADSQSLDARQAALDKMTRRLTRCATPPRPARGLTATAWDIDPRDYTDCWATPAQNRLPLPTMALAAATGWLGTDRGTLFLAQDLGSVFIR